MWKKIGRIIAAGITGFVFALSAFTPLPAQEPQLTLQAPGSVTVGQPFEVTYTVNVRGSKNFKAPAFKGLDILYGPAQSQSSSFQFVNGKQSQSFTLSYTYQLRAPREGTYNFEKACIDINGKTYYSEPFELTVKPAATADNNASQQNRTNAQQSPAAQQSSAEVSESDLFIRAIPSKREPYVGEEVILTYRIYTSIPIEQYSIYKTPSNKGFWTEELKIDPQSQNQETINGKNYIYADIRKVAIFAQEAGQHRLEPMEVEAMAQVRSQSRRRSRSLFDFFEDDFFTPVELVKKNLQSKPILINAKPLPQAGRPLSFDGLTGNYTVSFDYDKTKPLKTDEALTFTFKVSGKGNIEMIHAPDIQFPPDFEVYEPKISHQKTVNENGVSGSATFEYIVVPRNAGVYKIPAFDYSFFNPATGKYEEKNISETVLNIAPGKGASRGGIQNESKVSSHDIAHIQTGVPAWKKSGKCFLFSLPFLLSLAGEILLFLAALLLMKRNRKHRADIVGIKNRKAAKEAKRCLRKAARFLDENNRDAFHIEISQALWGFLANKLNISTAELSMENIRAELEKRKLNSELIEGFLQTLDHCEYARFAPKQGNGEDMKELYHEAWEIIYKMVGVLK